MYMALTSSYINSHEQVAKIICASYVIWVKILYSRIENNNASCRANSGLELQDGHRFNSVLMIVPPAHRNQKKI